MSIVLTPDSAFTSKITPSIFLAGTIDMGQSEDWQSYIISKLADLEVLIFNPRREFFERSVVNEKMQINWELDKLEQSDIIFMHLAPNSKSPVSLLELGTFMRTKKIILVVSESFYRYNNVMLTTSRYANDIEIYDNLSEGLLALRTELECQLAFNKGA